MSEVILIGVGTPHGDDAIGLEVARWLAAAGVPRWLDVRECARPARELLGLLSGAPAVVLVDALHAGGVPGSLQRLAPDELGRASAASSHGWGVAETLELARALGRAPRALAVLGVEIGAIPLAVAPAADLSPAVRAALPRAAALARSLAGELAGSPDALPRPARSAFAPERAE